MPDILVMRDGKRKVSNLVIQTPLFQKCMHYKVRCIQYDTLLLS